MPYRAIMITMVTVMLALLAVGMWMRSIAPMLAVVNASTQPSTQTGNVHPGINLPESAPSATAKLEPPLPAATRPEAERPDRQFKGLIKAVMIATFLIILVLFVIGFFTTLRAWLREPAKNKRTRYVDAWKIAGERLQAKKESDPGS